MTTTLILALVMSVLALGYLLSEHSLLGALNFAVLQWFGLRLACGWSTAHYPAGPTPGRWWSPHAPPRGVPAIFQVQGFMWPLTGWWSEYRFLSRRLHTYVLRWSEPPGTVRP